MLTVKIDDLKGIVTLEPNGPLTQHDFEIAAQKIDPFIERNGILNGVIVYSEFFPHWDSFSALLSHLKFVRTHEQHIACVAVVTDSALGKLVEPIASHFIHAQIKQFPYGALHQARQWIAEQIALKS